MLLKPVSFLRKASSVTPEFAWVSHGTSDSNADTTTDRTIAGLSFGAADASRDIWALIISFSSFSTGRTASAVTIGGVSATKVAAGVAWASGEVSLWRASVPTGTSGSVVVTPSGNWMNVAVSLYRGIGKQYASVSGGASGTSYPLAGDVNVTTGQTVIGGFIVLETGSGSAPTFSGLTQDFSPADSWPSGGFDEWYVSGSHTATGAETPRSIDLNYTPGGTGSGTFATFVLEDA